ncbi:MAG: SHOCT domain-containing protein [Flavobacteriales bacterium]
MKVMSIIGIVWFSLSFICVVGFSNGMNDEAVGWGMLGMLYAIPYSIVGIVQSNKKNKIEKSANQQLIELAELKEKGILSEDEFQAKKNDLLKM